MLPSWFRSINLLAVDGCFADPRLNGAIYLTQEICDTILMSFGHRKLGGSFTDFYGYFYGLSSSSKKTVNLVNEAVGMYNHSHAQQTVFYFSQIIPFFLQK